MINTPSVVAMPQADHRKVKSFVTPTAAATAMTGSGMAVTLSVLADLCCQVDDVDITEAAQLDWEFHPTQTMFGSGPRKYMLAAIIVNPLLVLAFLGILVAAAAVYKFKRKGTWTQALGKCRAPSLSHVPFLFLVQGTSLVAARLAFFPADSPAFVVVLGWCILSLCVASPAILYFGILKRLPGHVAHVPDPYLFPEPEETRRVLRGWSRNVYRFTFGDIIWVSKEGASFFAERNGLYFEAYRPGYAPFACVELAQTVALSLLSAWRPGTGAACNGRNALICAMFAATTAVFSVVRPHSAALDNLVVSAVGATMTVSVVLMTVALWAPSASFALLFSLAAHLLLVGAIVVFVKSLWDIFAHVVGLYMGRRKATRKLLRKSDHELLNPKRDDTELAEMHAEGTEPSEAETRRLQVPAAGAGVGLQLKLPSLGGSNGSWAPLRASALLFESGSPKAERSPTVSPTVATGSAREWRSRSAASDNFSPLPRAVHTGTHQASMRSIELV
ncbi:hypothetical protein DIPPA_14363 [Diplonema papillatum]|nr:hypothetical protein DIPPA_14363 [Diplonema papillatum]